jgi:hypothetical protein
MLHATFLCVSKVTKITMKHNFQTISVNFQVVEIYNVKSHAQNQITELYDYLLSISSTISTEMNALKKSHKFFLEFI